VAIADELALRMEEHVAEQQEQHLMCLHDDAMRFKGSTDVSTAASDATDMQSRLIVDDLMLATDGSEGASRADGSEGASDARDARADGCKRQRRISRHISTWLKCWKPNSGPEMWWSQFWVQIWAQF
jgi:hypothetical protein